MQCTTQQYYAKPRHQPSDRDQQARDRLQNKISRSKAKIKSRAYLQLGEKTLQTVHQTFEPNIPVILQIVTPQKKKQARIYIQLQRKDYIILLKDLHKQCKWHWHILWHSATPQSKEDRQNNQR